MKADAIINEEMTLTEKLAAIDRAIKNAQAASVKNNIDNSSAPFDPASLTICDGCE